MAALWLLSSRPENKAFPAKPYGAESAQITNTGSILSIQKNRKMPWSVESNLRYRLLTGVSLAQKNRPMLKIHRGRTVRVDDRKTKASMYRERAEEVRNVAEMVKGEVARKTLLQVVADYEELARQQDKLLPADDSIARAPTSLAPGRSGK